jgi:hypothetical protein
VVAATAASRVAAASSPQALETDLCSATSAPGASGDGRSVGPRTPWALPRESALGRAGAWRAGSARTASRCTLADPQARPWAQRPGPGSSEGRSREGGRAGRYWVRRGITGAVFRSNESAPASARSGASSARESSGECGVAGASKTAAHRRGLRCVARGRKSFEGSQESLDRRLQRRVRI